MRKDVARNRAALLAAGWDLFNSRGLGVTLDDVARAAGVGVGTAYRHFANKHELARAVLQEALNEMLTAAEAAASNPDGQSALREFFEAVLQPQAGKRVLGQVLRSDPAATPMIDVHARIEACINTLLATAHAQRTIRPGVTSTDIGVLMAMMEQVVDRFADIDDQLWRRFLPVILDGLTAEDRPRLPGDPLDRDQFLQHLKSSS